MSVDKAPVRPTLRSVIGRGHLSLALMAVSMASISLTLLGVLALRVYADHNLHLIARSINYTVEAAVVFNDSAAATEALGVIASEEEVAEAEVFNVDGKQLAHWERPETGMLSMIELQLAHALLEQPITQPILHQGQVIGSVHLTGHGGSLLRFLLSGLAGILVCTALSAWVALYLARRLLRGITGPLHSLASVAHAARSERAFDRRVPPAKIAELDSLGNDFNALLDELEAWQTHLQSENETLAHQASHDSLTGLPNRAFFEGRLIRALRSAAKLNEKVAVCSSTATALKTSTTTSATPPAMRYWWQWLRAFVRNCVKTTWWHAWAAMNSPSCCRLCTDLRTPSALPKKSSPAWTRPLRCPATPTY